jgi:hypothetical protein
MPVVLVPDWPAVPVLPDWVPLTVVPLDPPTVWLPVPELDCANAAVLKHAAAINGMNLLSMCVSLNG